MKTKRELKRRGWFGFNSIDRMSGYALRVEQGRDGFWWAFTASDSVAVGGGGASLGKARSDVAQAIQYWLEYMADKGLPIPPPERKCV